MIGEDMTKSASNSVLGTAAKGSLPYKTYLKDSDSYNPISLLSSLSTIFEKIMHLKLENFLESIDVIPKFQIGFKSHHSTTQQLLPTTENINNAFILHHHTGAVFIDISKAFDKM